MREIGDVGDPLNPLLDVTRHSFSTDTDLDRAIWQRLKVKIALRVPPYPNQRSGLQLDPIVLAC